jgi:hypothetical protein
MSTTLGKSDPPAFKRRRGAPLGNANAFKHGFYSTRTPLDGQALRQRLSTGLQTEIEMVDNAILNLLGSLEAESPPTWKQALDQLRAITLAVTAKTSLLRIQSSLQQKLANLEETGARLSDFLTSIEDETSLEPPIFPGNDRE